MDYLTEADRHADEWPTWKVSAWIAFLILAPWLLVAGLGLGVYVMLRALGWA